MELDFRIECRHISKNYENLQWEECCSWKNYWNVKYIFEEVIEFTDYKCYYPISIGTMQILIGILSDRLQKIDLNDVGNLNEYNISKLLVAIEDLSKILGKAIWNECEGISYEYRVLMVIKY